MHIMRCHLQVDSGSHSHETRIANNIEDENYPVGMGETIAEALLSHCDLWAVRVLMEAAKYLEQSGNSHTASCYVNERFYAEAREGIKRDQRRIDKQSRAAGLK